MSLTLVRVDDRLIHGQVVVGWGRWLKADQILLIDDRISADEWERELCRMGVPADMDVEFATISEAPAALERWVESSKRTIVVIGDIDTMVEVCHTSDLVRSVNLGGIHQGEGRTKRLRYVFLTDEEADQLRALANEGVDVTAQDVPSTRAIPLAEFV